MLVPASIRHTINPQYLEATGTSHKPRGDRDFRLSCPLYGPGDMPWRSVLQTLPGPPKGRSHVSTFVAFGGCRPRRTPPPSLSAVTDGLPFTVSAVSGFYGKDLNYWKIF